MAILIILNRRILKGMRVLNNSRRGPVQPQEEQQFVNNAAAERSQRRHMNEIRATQMAIAIVISFVVLNLPRIAISFKEVTNTNLILFCIENKTGFYNSVEYFQIDVVARMFMMVNSAINFVIYSAVSHPFQVNYSSYCSWYQWHLLYIFVWISVTSSNIFRKPSAEYSAEENFKPWVVALGDVFAPSSIMNIRTPAMRMEGFQHLLRLITMT